MVQLIDSVINWLIYFKLTLARLHVAISHFSWLSVTSFSSIPFRDQDWSCSSLHSSSATSCTQIPLGPRTPFAVNYWHWRIDDYSKNNDMIIIIKLCHKYNSIGIQHVIDIPGHPCKLQSLNSVACPTQSIPPFRALCCKILVRFWDPPSQGLLHSLHSVYGPHLQFP